MNEVENGKLSFAMKYTQNKVLKTILVIFITGLILGTAFSSVFVARATPTHDEVWDSGDVPSMIDFMAEHWDPFSMDWKSSLTGEDRAIAEEMLRVMTLINDKRESLPYSCDDATGQLGSYYSENEEAIMDAVDDVVGFLRLPAFHDQIDTAFSRISILDALESSSLFIDLIIHAADVIEDELVDINDVVGMLPDDTATMIAEGADVIDEIGEFLETVFVLCDLAIILISHYFVFHYALSLTYSFPDIVSQLISYEVGSGIFDILSFSVEHMKMIFDVFALIAAEVGNEVGRHIGLQLGMSAGTLVFPGVGTLVGGVVGSYIGAEVVSALMESMVKEAYFMGTQLEYLPQAAYEKFTMYYYEKNMRLEIIDIWSSGDDNYVPLGEKIYVRVKNTGFEPATFRISPIADSWTIFAAPDDMLEIAAFLLNPIGTLTGIMIDNSRYISLNPGEEEIVWFLATPYGLKHQFPFIKKHAFDNVGFMSTYKYSLYRTIQVGERIEGFTSAGSGPAFYIQPTASQEIYDSGDTVTVDILIDNIGTETGTFTLGVSFKHLSTNTEYGNILIQPSGEVTITQGGSTVFLATWVVPSGAPLGQYQIAVNCWENAYTILYPDNLEWQDIFIISSPIIGTDLYILEQSPAELDLYDPGGRHVGKDQNFTGATYTYDPGTDDRTIEVINLHEGQYKIVLTGIIVGPYTLDIKVNQNSNPIYQKTYNNNIDIDEVHEFYVVISVNELGQISASSTAPEIPYEPLPPIADAGDDITTEEGKETQFDGTRSSAPEGRITKYEWDFNEDGIFDATGPYPTFIYYDDCIVTVTLQVTSEIETSSTDDNGNEVIEIITMTDTDTLTVTVLNVDPTASIDRGYMYVDFTLRGAGEKWHNMYWDLYVTDEAGETDRRGDGGTVGIGEIIAHLEIERWPGDPDSQSDTVYDVYIDSERIYYFVATYFPYEDDMPINGQLHGSNPIWIDLTFEDGSTERIHHNFNVKQSIIRDSDHWVHIEPWYVDLSPWFVTHTWTFEGSTTDVGTDDETFTWDWDDATPFDTAFYTYRRPDSTTDPFPSPYDRDEGAYPMAVTDIQYHAYMYEDDFDPELTITDDDHPSGGENGNDGKAEDMLDVDAIHSREIYLPSGIRLARK